MDLHERISINPKVCHGEPCIKGTRIMVTNILAAIAEGLPMSEILQDFPGITTEDEFVFNTALADGRTLITFDEGIGDYRVLPLPEHHPGVIRLKLHPQRWQWISARLEQFL
jgi:uncharacterized protein (DUF433 family)